jgi:glycosyltransferase involved in cell wall biosynthesis
MNKKYSDHQNIQMLAQNKHPSQFLSEKNNLLQFCDTTSDPLFWPSSRQGVVSSWYGHVPFAHWLVANIRPKLVVELGTYTGVSYAAFCESIKKMKIDSRCYAVDTWRGDLNTGYYGDDIYHDLNKFNNIHYSNFSTLIRDSFDSALGKFEDRSIDLLHIDGSHKYDEVRHDFETWLPKMSDNGIILFHNTSMDKPDFGVHRLWIEIHSSYPHFEFTHAHGLGILAVGTYIPKQLDELFSVKEEEIVERLCYRFSRLGESDSLKSALVTRIIESTVLDIRNRDQKISISYKENLSGFPLNVSNLDLNHISFGIGIVTYNRADRLIRCIEQVKKHTKRKFELLVADDGSTDGTSILVSGLVAPNITYLNCENKGVNWNKNRILYYFRNIKPVDVVIILEDDSFPYKDSWEDKWIRSALKFGHVNNAGEWFADSFESGSGDIDDPFLSFDVSAQCAAFAYYAIDRVGYIDSYLENFGAAHAEHSYRMSRVGYGGEFRVEAGIGKPLYYLINGAIQATREDSNYEVDDPIGWARYWELRDTAIFRFPWKNDVEKQKFLLELATAQRI